ncbi:carbonic anhydrase [Photobacterium nomapromontoriensis]|uniref:carbonic anhydrase n=1 Tax=Photobacterium nomapromontoriensis TaxID=2910237 RepID=UPI003D0FE8B1
MKKHTLAVLVLTAAICGVNTASAAEWSYQGEHGAAHWGEEFATCSQGMNQTPVDIKTPTEAELAPLHIDYQGTVTNIINNGHTVQANVSGNNTLQVDGDTFELKQFHFHTPSENFIDGKQFPLEVHFVHANSKGQLAVISAMFETGPRGNEAFNDLLTTIPANGEQIAISNPLSPAALLPREREYFRFNGSLTTPPCSEGVRWFVMQEHQTSSKSQTDALHNVMGNNARPLQPLNARLILK